MRSSTLRPRQDKDGGELRVIRDKYFDVLERQIITPARKDLTELQKRLQKEIRDVGDEGRDAQIMQRGLKRELDKVSRALEGLEGGFRRAQTLRLSDLPKFRG
jgi:hypothetical protein